MHFGNKSQPKQSEEVLFMRRCHETFDIEYIEHYVQIQKCQLCNKARMYNVVHRKKSTYYRKEMYIVVHKKKCTWLSITSVELGQGGDQ